MCFVIFFEQLKYTGIFPTKGEASNAPVAPVICNHCPDILRIERTTNFHSSELCCCDLLIVEALLFLICFPMNYRDILVKINSENNSEITSFFFYFILFFLLIFFFFFVFTVCKKQSVYEFSAKSLAQKV